MAENAMCRQLGEGTPEKQYFGLLGVKEHLGTRVLDFGNIARGPREGAASKLPLKTTRWEVSYFPLLKNHSLTFDNQPVSLSSLGRRGVSNPLLPIHLFGHTSRDERRGFDQNNWHSV